MKPLQERRMPGFSLILLLAGGFMVLALLVLVPDYAQARLDGSQPVPLLSGLQADYSKDPLEIVIQPVDEKVVEQIIVDRTTSTALPPKQQAATVISELLTPVYTITPTPEKTKVVAVSPTSGPLQATNTGSAFTPTRAVTSTTQIQTSPTAIGFTGTPTASQTVAASLTQTTGTVSPTFTKILTVSATRTPRPTSTSSATPPGKTVTPSPRPTFTPRPTMTFTPTHPAETAAVTRTFTRTPIPTSVLSPTSTFTPTWTRAPSATFTFTPRPPTATFTPTKTRTPVYYPPPSTNTPTGTAVPYP